MGFEWLSKSNVHGDISSTLICKYWDMSQISKNALFGIYRHPIGIYRRHGPRIASSQLLRPPPLRHCTCGARCRCPRSGRAAPWLLRFLGPCSTWAEPLRGPTSAVSYVSKHSRKNMTSALYQKNVYKCYYCFLIMISIHDIWMSKQVPPDFRAHFNIFRHLSLATPSTSTGHMKLKSWHGLLYIDQCIFVFGQRATSLWYPQ